MFISISVGDNQVVQSAPDQDSDKAKVEEPNPIQDKVLN